MATFPAINALGVITQRPYTESTHFRTAVNNLPSGKRYSRAWWTAPTPGSPASLGQALRSFRVTYPVITRAEITVLENFFNSMRGGYGLFSFTDQDGVVHPACRFASDEFGMRYDDPGFHSVELDIDEYIASTSLGAPLTLTLSVWAEGVNWNGSSFDPGLLHGTASANWSLAGFPGANSAGGLAKVDTSMDPATDLFGFYVFFQLLYSGAQINTAPPGDVWRIYDIYVTAVYATTTVKYRPFNNTYDTFGNSSGDMVDPLLASDHDTAMPSTYSQIQRWHFSNLSNPTIQAFSAFLVPF